MNAAKGSGGVGLFLKERITLEYKIDIIDNLVDGILGIKLTNKLTKLTFVVLSFSKQCDTASASGLKFSHDDHNKDNDWIFNLQYLTVYVFCKILKKYTPNAL